MLMRTKSFVLYKKGHSSLPTLLVQDDLPKTFSEIDQLNCKNGFLIAPFKISSDHPLLLLTPSLQVEGLDIIEEQLLENQFAQIVNCEEISLNLTCSFEQYRELFGETMEQLQRGIMDKVVLARSEELLLDNPNLFAIFKKAITLYPYQNVFLFYTPYSGLWLSITPELLLEGEKGAWHTMSLAGTMTKEERISGEEWSDKNKKEQKFVTDYLIDELHGLAVDFIQIENKEVEAAHLTHLCTDLYFQKDFVTNLGTLIKALFPTPAICGLPKKEAYNFILNHEVGERSYYSGFIGWLEPNKKTELFVLLRCVHLMQKRKGLLYAGGGIIGESKLNNEWEETERKMATIRSLFL